MLSGEREPALGVGLEFKAWLYQYLLAFTKGKSSKKGAYLTSHYRYCHKRGSRMDHGSKQQGTPPGLAGIGDLPPQAEGIKDFNLESAR